MELYEEIEKSFPKIEKLFAEEYLLEFLKTPFYDLDEYNFGLGTMIRLKLLRPSNLLYKNFIQNGYYDREEMSMEMIREFHSYIQDK